MKRLFALAVVSSLAWAASPIPRKAPDFVIVEPSGKQIPLSSFKGKVVVLEFLDTTCPHCQHTSVMLSMLKQQLGPRGFQPIRIATYNNAPPQVIGFLSQFSPSYPVGISDNDTVVKFLGFSPQDRVMVPQIVVIDRKGMIRGQTPPMSDKNMQDQDYMRTLIEALLKEGAPAKRPS